MKQLRLLLMAFIGLALLITGCKKVATDATVAPHNPQKSAATVYLVKLKTLSARLQEQSARVHNQASARLKNTTATERTAYLQNAKKELLAATAPELCASFEDAHIAQSDIVAFTGEGFNAFTAKLTPGQVAILRKHNNVASVSAGVEGTTADDPSVGVSEFVPNGVFGNVAIWGGQNPFLQTVTNWGYDAVRGASNSVTENASREVWVLDSGVDPDHPDLNLNKDKSFNGMYFYDGTFEQDTYIDRVGHGTHVAGVIAAKRGNNRGIDGMTAGPVNVCKIMELDPATGIAGGNSLNVFNTLADLFNFGLLQSGHIVNLSLGYNGVDPNLTDILRFLADRNIKFVIAANNFAIDAGLNSPAIAALPSSDNAKNATFTAPGNAYSFKHYKNIYVVSATDRYRNFANSYSNFGNAVTISAPGTNIPSLSRFGRYSVRSGTSMAAPFVTALLKFGDGGLYTFSVAFAETYRFNGNSSILIGPYAFGDVDTRNDCRVTKRFSSFQTFKAED